MSTNYFSGDTARNLADVIATEIDLRIAKNKFFTQPSSSYSARAAAAAHNATSATSLPTQQQQHHASRMAAALLSGNTALYQKLQQEVKEREQHQESASKARIREFLEQSGAYRRDRYYDPTGMAERLSFFAPSSSKENLAPGFPYGGDDYEDEQQGNNLDKDDRRYFFGEPVNRTNSTTSFLQRETQLKQKAKQQHSVEADLRRARQRFLDGRNRSCDDNCKNAASPIRPAESIQDSYLRTRVSALRGAVGGLTRKLLCSVPAGEERQQMFGDLFEGGVVPQITATPSNEEQQQEQQPPLPPPPQTEVLAAIRRAMLVRETTAAQLQCVEERVAAMARNFREKLAAKPATEKFSSNNNSAARGDEQGEHDVDDVDADEEDLEQLQEKGLAALDELRCQTMLSYVVHAAEVLEREAANKRAGGQQPQKQEQQNLANSSRLSHSKRSQDDNNNINDDEDEENLSPASRKLRLLQRGLDDVSATTGNGASSTLDNNKNPDPTNGGGSGPSRVIAAALEAERNQQHRLITAAVDDAKHDKKLREQKQQLLQRARGGGAATPTDTMSSASNDNHLNDDGPNPRMPTAAAVTGSKNNFNVINSRAASQSKARSESNPAGAAPAAVTRKPSVGPTLRSATGPMPRAPPLPDHNIHSSDSTGGAATGSAADENEEDDVSANSNRQHHHHRRQKRGKPEQSRNRSAGPLQNVSFISPSPSSTSFHFSPPNTRGRSASTAPGVADNVSTASTATRQQQPLPKAPLFGAASDLVSPTRGTALKSNSSKNNKQPPEFADDDIPGVSPVRKEKDDKNRSNAAAATPAPAATSSTSRRGSAAGSESGASSLPAALSNLRRLSALPSASTPAARRKSSSPSTNASAAHHQQQHPTPSGSNSGLASTFTAVPVVAVGMTPPQAKDKQSQQADKSSVASNNSGKGKKQPSPTPATASSGGGFFSCFSAPSGQ